MLRAAKSAVFAASLLALLHCGVAAEDSDATGTTATTAQNMSTVIHTTYGLTTFGGPGDYQTLACTNQSSKVDQPWYVASSQRYGCGVHLKITTAAGKCVVARTDDAGPATFVENDAGIAVLDSSPSVTNYLFGVSDGLGWSDLRDHPGRYEVTAVTTTLPLGPCDGSGPSPTPPSPSPPGGGTTGSGASCSGDGDCNPGNDGSGQICSGGTCVAGCRSDAQCPGVTSCVSGQCK